MMQLLRNLKSKLSRLNPIETALGGWAVCASLAALMVLSHFVIRPLPAYQLAINAFLVGFAVQGIFVTKLLRQMRDMNALHRDHVEALMSLLADTGTLAAERKLQ